MMLHASPTGASSLPRFLVYCDMNGRLVSAAALHRVGLIADVIGSRLSVWVRAPNPRAAREHVAGLLHRAGYEVAPIALTTPIKIENDNEPCHNVCEG